MGVAAVDAVGDGAVVEQRGEHLVNGTLDVVEAFDVEEGFLLTGEGGIGQVFRGRRAAHRHLEIGMLAGQRLVGRAQVLFERRGQRCIDDPLADLGADACKFRHVINI